MSGSRAADGLDRSRVRVNNSSSSHRAAIGPRCREWGLEVAGRGGPKSGL